MINDTPYKIGVYDDFTRVPLLEANKRVLGNLIEFSALNVGAYPTNAISQLLQHIDSNVHQTFGEQLRLVRPVVSFVTANDTVIQHLLSNGYERSTSLFSDAIPALRKTYVVESASPSSSKPSFTITITQT